MKSKRNLWICIMVTLLMFFASLAGFYFSGWMRDEFGLSGMTGIIDNGILQVGLLLLVLLALQCLVYQQKSAFFNSKLVTRAVAVFTGVVFLFGTYVAVVHTSYYSGLIKERKAGEVMAEITLEQLDKMLNQQKSGIIYIGRDSCVPCNEVLPLLKNYGRSHPLEIQYYNTAYDREHNSEEMKQTLDVLGISEVPALIVLEAGKVKEFFSSREGIEDYLVQNNK